MHAHIRLDHQLLAVEGEHDVHAMLELTVPASADSAAHPPVRLALVIDRSGSMAGAKLEIAKRCAGWLLSRLRPTDEVALVAFDDHVRLLAPLGPVEGRPLAAALGSVYPGGSTNLSGGWLRGLEQLQGAGEGTKSILLLTDGQANVGVLDHGSLTGLTRTARGAGVSTTTIGFGADFDENLMTAMADAGGGNAHYAETPDAAPGIFERELTGLMSVAAQNVSIEIRPGSDVQIVEVLNDYPAVPVAGGIQLELGDAYAGETRRVVFGLHIPRLGELGAAQVGTLVLRYVSVGEEIAHHEQEIPIVVNAVSADEASAVAPDAGVRDEVLILSAARARDEAIRHADAGGHDAALQRVNRTAAELRLNGLELEADQLEQLRPLLSPTTYSPSDRKRMHYESNLRKRGR